MVASLKVSTTSLASTVSLSRSISLSFSIDSRLALMTMQARLPASVISASTSWSISLAVSSEYSEDTAKLIDQEVEALITEAGNRACMVIKANRESIEKLKDILLDKETVEASEVVETFKDATMPAAAALY